MYIHIRTYNEFLVIYIGSFDTPSTKREVHQPSNHCILPQNSPNSQKPLAEIFSHGLHRTRRILVHPVCAIVGGYGIPTIPTQPPNYFPTEATEPNHLWASAKSVGGSSTPEISVCSVNSVGGLAEGGVGVAGMPYPPNLWASVKSVGGSSLPEASVSSVNSVGEPYAAKPSVSICEICGRIIKWAAWVWQGCHTLLICELL